MAKLINKHFDQTLDITSYTKSGNMYKVFMFMGSVIHILYTGLFFFTRVYPLMIYNIFAAILWMVLFVNFKISKLRPLLIIINAEFLVFLAITIINIGWNYQFFCYLFIFVPLSLLSSMDYKKKTYNLKLAYIQFTIMMITMSILIIKFGGIDARYTFNEQHNKLFNIIGVFHIIIASITAFFLFLAVIVDINTTTKKLEAINNELTFIATHDPLTNLINRRSMNNYFTMAIDNYGNGKKPFSFILADIDDFKKVNDIYGHDAGDIVLKRTSKIIMDIVGENGAVCRWGGEEILILINQDLTGAVKVAENIRASVQATSFVFNNTYIKTTLTLGVASYKPDLSINKLITQADANLYKGKKSTKNCVVS